jgi:hypothetical protein
VSADAGWQSNNIARCRKIDFDRQHAFHPDGLINIPSPRMPPKLNAIHKAFLARIVEQGPIAAIHGVVRWRACDLIMRKAYKQNAEAMDAFKKTSRQSAPNRGAGAALVLPACNTEAMQASPR